MEIILHSKKDGSTRIIINGEIKAKLCRCGQSKTMPLCDSTHKLVGWIAEESLVRISVPDGPAAGPQPEAKQE